MTRLYDLRLTTYDLRRLILNVPITHIFYRPHQLCILLGIINEYFPC